jgi:NAD(P)-dependent dehydrogenase (short-subunit alcohol dehydrogenase family)
MSRLVAVTGASAGIGRAAAVEFARRGDRVALIARGETGLDAAAAQIRELGVQVLAVPTDVADYAQVAAAVERIEDEMGPIHVWVNAAFSSVFARFDDVTPEEYRRATEVTYLGFVWGTMAVLPRMKRRGHGTIVHVGSSLAYRGVPLQTVYCGAKHATQGFHESLRCELLHDRSDIHVTMVQMPAVNTPQFSWVLSRLPKHAQPVPPIYQPEVAARAILHAADHGGRERWVGRPTIGTILAERIAPALLDRHLARTGYDAQQTDEPVPAGRPDNLDGPLPGDRGAHGRFGAMAQPVSRTARARERIGRLRDVRRAGSRR